MAALLPSRAVCCWVRGFLGASNRGCGSGQRDDVRRIGSTGGKERLGRISKMGNRYLRKLLVVGAHAVLYHRKPHTDALRMWATKLMEKKPFKLVAVALANKMARIAFAILRGRTS